MDAVFFVDIEDRLIGILTDGDIRRLNIEEINLINTNHINKNYYYETDLNKIIKNVDLSKKYIPILDSKKKILGIVNGVSIMQEFN